jgi:hypothetical protein
MIYPLAILIATTFTPALETARGFEKPAASAEVDLRSVWARHLEVSGFGKPIKAVRVLMNVTWQPRREDFYVPANAILYLKGGSRYRIDWKQAEASGVYLQSDDKEAARQRNEAEYDLLFLDRAGFEVEPIGLSTVEGVPAYEFRLTHRNGTVLHAHLDRAGLNLIKTEIEGQDGSTLYWGHERVGERTTFRRELTRTEGATHELTCHDWEWDPELDDSIFEKQGGTK